MKKNSYQDKKLPEKSSSYFYFASLGVEELLQNLKTSLEGLTDEEAKRRLGEYGYNELAKKKKRTIILQIIYKFTNPLVLVLLIIAIFSLFLGETINALIVSFMAGLSVLISFVQEYRAGKEVERLSEMVRTSATVYRDGKAKELKIRELVPGDIVDLFAGDMIPADLRIIQAKDLFINQAALTGESLPIEKTGYPLSIKNANLLELNNIAFMGSSVVSGTALGVVIKTGTSTQFGELSKKLRLANVESAFDKGIRSFTWMMIRLMLILVLIIFAINTFFKKGDTLQAFLFSLSVAVGLTPQMLPMLVTINLSKGAISMSEKQVIVKRLSAIQNFGAMDVLCTDKTGTLTLDKIVLERHCDVIRREDEDVLYFAYINSFYQTGLKNILDRTILRHEKILLKNYKKIDEVPFDFSRKMMSVVVECDSRHRMITKGAPEEVFKRCTQYELDGEIFDMDSLILMDLKEEYDKLSAEGFRVLAVAYKDFINPKESYSKEDENELILKGYIAFLDPPKPSTRRTIERLKNLGIDFKVLTGDNELVTKKICEEIGLSIQGMVTGEQIQAASDEQLKEMVKSANVFSRLSPFQKERVIYALHKNGHIVGYLGDGINDALALKAADVGISVNNAVDIAKESADIILLKKSLLVLSDGVIEGRRTFGNILKYIKMGSSSNFGNMISMTGASIFLPFLPMLPLQILLNNFLYDLSQIAIPSDEVDREYLLKSRPWNVNYIKKFMLVFGPVSSFFDFLTFGILLFIFKATAETFRTVWFLESLCTQTLVIHIIRTGKIPFKESKSSQFLIFTSLYIITIALIIPFTPLGRYFDFALPRASFFIMLIIIILTYLISVQKVKVWFIKRYGYE
ncbi:MAG: magnesium-translocating P-type ATPase [Candidatus Omnitrophica bacterium]|nr:magnesium-translocating P-type ATPase [Candidatus Omnitrophota bacterium]